MFKNIPTSWEASVWSLRIVLPWPPSWDAPTKTNSSGKWRFIGIAFPKLKMSQFPANILKEGQLTSQVVRLYTNGSPENEECCKHISFSNHHFPGDVFVFKAVTVFLWRYFNRNSWAMRPDEPVVGIPIFAYLVFGWLDFSGWYDETFLVLRFHRTYVFAP